tara:strand:+ start:800 stop:1051 length:252 start_codon:yes stop_codon:yes gene_type:complete
MAECLCRMALDMNKKTTEQIESLSDYFVTEMIQIIQKAIEKKVDELDAEFDKADQTTERREEIRTVVRDMVNDGDITVSLDWS